VFNLSFLVQSEGLKERKERNNAPQTWMIMERMLTWMLTTVSQLLVSIWLAQVFHLRSEHKSLVVPHFFHGYYSYLDSLVVSIIIELSNTVQQYSVE